MKKNRIKKIIEGFSLVEMIIYIFLLTLLMTAVVRSIVTVSSSYGSLRNTKTISSSAETLLNRFNYEVKTATNFSGTFGTSSGSLTLSQGPTTTIFSLNGAGRAVISINGSTDYLTSTDVKVTKLAFYKLQAASSSLGVTLQATLQNSKDVKIESENFESTVLIRKSIQ
jgi:type II secretory pathway pseudopilin PulG